MECKLVAVGKRMPRWVDDAVEDFSRRFSSGIKFKVVSVATTKRTRADNPTVYKNHEAKALLAQIKDGDWVVALEVGGKSRTTEQLAKWLDQRIEAAKSLVLLVGGPDGLADQCLERANERWSLSDLTLPHGLARVVVVEALYRADTLRIGHPYHRA